MNRPVAEHLVDDDVLRMLDVMNSYKVLHAQAEIESYRHSSASIRLRIIDPDFRGLDRVEREELVWELVERLSEDIQQQLSVLVLLTPEEIKTSIANRDFENPIPSRL